MPPVDRNNPIRATSSESQYSLMEFMRSSRTMLPAWTGSGVTASPRTAHHAYCPKCERERKFHVAERPAWDCDSCGHHLHPSPGRSSTSPRPRCPVVLRDLPDDEHSLRNLRQALERELGVTYKTAWRMFNLIRNQLMADDGKPLRRSRGRRDIRGRQAPQARPILGPGRPEVGPPLRSDANPERRRATVLAAVERRGSIKATVCRPAAAWPAHRGHRVGRADVHRLHRRVAGLQPARPAFAA